MINNSIYPNNLFNLFEFICIKINLRGNAPSQKNLHSKYFYKLKFFTSKCA